MRLIPSLVLAVACSAAVTSTASAQSGGSGFNVTLGAGLPQGEFADAVKFVGGFGLGGIWAIAPSFALRGELDFSIYGSQTRTVPLGSGPLGLITVDVTTTNAIVGGHIGAQLGTPGPGIRPYVGGMIGFNNFNTRSSVRGAGEDPGEEFASSTNASDNTFAKTALAGLYIGVGRTGNVKLDLGVRHTWNGESVEYLTKDDITFDGNNDPVLTPHRTRADILTIVFGVTITGGLREQTK